jgi:lysophospholipase L1-like esterase
MSRIRWFDLAAIVLSIAVLAGLGFALRQQHTPTITVAPSTAHVDRPQPPARTRPSALIIGDSYSSGSGLAEMSYGCMAAVKMGWLCHLSGQPGTGYISGGEANRFDIEYMGPSTSFDERLPRLAAMYEPDIVILDGGRNDLFPPPDAVFDVMSATIADVRQTWPRARIVFIRPRVLARPDDNLGFDDEFIARLQAEPTAQDLVVIDPIRRFTATDTSTLLSNDGTHPNQQGAQALSSALVDSLRERGFGSTT